MNILGLISQLIGIKTLRLTVNIIIQGRSQNNVVLCICDFPKTTPHLISFLILKVTKEFFFVFYILKPSNIYINNFKIFYQDCCFWIYIFPFLYKHLIIERIYSKWTTFKPIIKYINTRFPLIIKKSVMHLCP